MSISTRSQFYYGHLVDQTNYALDFSEGGPELQASIDVGDYSMTSLMDAVATQLNAEGTETYTVTVDRTTRFVTIAATGTFELKVSSGSRIGVGIFALLGFTGADRTGASSYIGNLATGSVFRPQSIFREYVAFEDWEEAVDAKVNESSSGDNIETISFGTRQFMEFIIENITDLPQPSIANYPIEEDLSGRANARAFMQFARKRARMEFMEDRDDPATFSTVLIEKTPSSRAGVGFKFEKMYDEAITGYYETGKLQFRKVT